MKHYFVRILTVAALMVPFCVQAKQTEQSVAQSEQSTRKDQGIWIDVREPEEFEQGHISGAKNIPVGRIAQEITRISPDKNAPLNLYCRSGRRSEAALQVLKKLGYTHVANQGGYQSLLGQGIR